jgi:hypothetical protein
LTPGDEFCKCEPPTGWENIKAVAAALGTAAVGAAAQFGVTLATGRVWDISTIAIGGLVGWLVHQAAGRHRSVLIGAVAAGATALACGAGYGLLWLPSLHRAAVAQAVGWFYLPMVALGGFVAYRLAGPITSSESL